MSTIAFLGATGGCANATLISALCDGNKCIALARNADKLRNTLRVEDMERILVDANGSLVDTIVSGLGSAPALTFKWPFITLENPLQEKTAAATLISALDTLYHNQSAPLKATTTSKPGLVFISTTGISRGPEDVPFWLRFIYHVILAVPHQDKKKMEDIFRSSEAKSQVFRSVTGIRPTLLAGSVNVNDQLGLDRVRAGTEQDPAIGYQIKHTDVGNWIYANAVRPGEAKAKWEGQMCSLT